MGLLVQYTSPYRSFFEIARLTTFLMIFRSSNNYKNTGMVPTGIGPWDPIGNNFPRSVKYFDALSSFVYFSCSKLLLLWLVKNVMWGSLPRNKVKGKLLIVINSCENRSIYFVDRIIKKMEYFLKTHIFVFETLFDISFCRRTNLLYILTSERVLRGSKSFVSARIQVFCLLLSLTEKRMKKEKESTKTTKKKCLQEFK